MPTSADQYRRRSRGPIDAAKIIPGHVPAKPHCRGGVVRKRLGDSRRPQPTHLYINAMSAIPITDWEITDGAFRCLSLIVQKAGGPGVAEFAIESLETFTQSLATLLGRDVRTVRGYLIELEAAGYLRRWVCPDNKVHIQLSERLQPRAGASMVPVERKIRVPATWARPRQGKPKRSGNAGKISSAIDPSRNFNPLQAAPAFVAEPDTEEAERLAEVEARRFNDWAAREDHAAQLRAAEQIRILGGVSVFDQAARDALVQAQRIAEVKGRRPQQMPAGLRERPVAVPKAAPTPEASRAAAYDAEEAARDADLARRQAEWDAGIRPPPEEDEDDDEEGVASFRPLFRAPD